MALKAEIEKLEDVPEDQRGLYRQAGERFRLDVEGVEFPDDTRGLKSALEKEREENRRLNRTLKSLPPDFDAEKWAQMTQAEKDRAEEEAKKKGEWDNLKAQLKDAHTKEMKQKDDEIGSLTRELETQMIDAEAARLLADKVKGSAKLLMPHIRERVVAKKEDGRWVRQVIDPDTKKIRLGSKGENMTMEELLLEMRGSDEFAGAFDASGATGSGGTGRNAAGGGTGGVRTKADLKDVPARVKWMKEHGGPDAYAALPDK